MSAGSTGEPWLIIRANSSFNSRNGRSSTRWFTVIATTPFFSNDVVIREFENIMVFEYI